MTKPTPGPWFVDHDGARTIIKSDRVYICGFERDYAGANEYQELFEARIKRQTANARLIAAAPELYALLDEINAAFYCRTSKKAWLELMARTKPLLRKARGEDTLS